MSRIYIKTVGKGKGVTIIELVISMVILAILAVFATSTYSNYATRAKIAN